VRIAGRVHRAAGPPPDRSAHRRHRRARAGRSGHVPHRPGHLPSGVPVVAGPARRPDCPAGRTEEPMTITFPQRLLLVARVYGMIVIVPMFFLEQAIGEYAEPAITHPEFYYGFVSVAFAWQIGYLMMSRDPLRFRPMLIPAIVGKAGFAVSVF